MITSGTLQISRDIGLGRHQTFHLRAGWLVKALHALHANSEALAGPESHHDLGVGKNMLEAIRFWVVATRLAEPTGRSPRTRRMELRLTRLGDTLLRHDPYLEDATSLWVIHVALASNDHGAAAWYWLFNEADGFEFTDRRMISGFSSWLDGATESQEFSESQVRRELSCLRRTYLHEQGAPKANSLDDQLTCPLASLGLVSRNESGNLQLRVGKKPNMPLDVVLFALHRFVAMGESTVFSIDDLRWERFSPGRLLGLDSPTLLEALLQLQARRGSGIQVAQTAGLGNVSLVPTDPLDILAGYYDRHPA